MLERLLTIYYFQQNQKKEKELLTKVTKQMHELSTRFVFVFKWNDWVKVLFLCYLSMSFLLFFSVASGLLGLGLLLFCTIYNNVPSIRYITKKKDIIKLNYTSSQKQNVRSDQSSLSFRVGHCHRQLIGMNKYINYITGK